MEPLLLQPLCRTARALCATAAASVALDGACAAVDADPSLGPATAEAPGLHIVARLPFGPQDAGCLTLLDTAPRALSDGERARLGDLLTVAGQALALHRQAGRASADGEFFRLLAETTTDTLVRGDLDGNRLYISPSITALLGYAPEELIGGKAADITHPDDLPAFRALMQTVREGRLDVGVTELRQRHKDGRWIWMEASLRLTTDRTDGRPDGYVASVRDIGARKALEAQLARMASYDELTGLPNRALFQRLLRETVQRAGETGRPFALLYMDLDDFKRVNDSLGHKAGDAVLRETAARFRAVLRQGDPVARMGGDEFTAILAVNREQAARLCARLIETVSEPFAVEGRTIHIGISIGAVMATENDTDTDMLLSHADAALYAAKEAGKNAVRFWEAG